MQDCYSLTHTVLIVVMIATIVSSSFWSILILIMKILTNFDTRLYDALKQDYINQYGPENVMIIKRASIFFWIYIIVPLILLLIVMSFILWLAFGINIADESLQMIIHIVSGIIWIWVLRVRWFRITKRYMDYTMDFCIITPKELVSYNQSWLFNRQTEIIDTEKIKTINKIPQWFFGSIFNFASLVFLSEWDMDTGDISLNFVENAEETYKQVRMIIEPHLNKIAGETIFVK